MNSEVQSIIHSLIEKQKLEPSRVTTMPNLYEFLRLHFFVDINIFSQLNLPLEINHPPPILSPLSSSFYSSPTLNLLENKFNNNSSNEKINNKNNSNNLNILNNSNMGNSTDDKLSIGNSSQLILSENYQKQTLNVKNSFFKNENIQNITQGKFISAFYSFFSFSHLK